MLSQQHPHASLNGKRFWKHSWLLSLYWNVNRDRHKSFVKWFVWKEECLFLYFFLIFLAANPVSSWKPFSRKIHELVSDLIFKLITTSNLPILVVASNEHAVGCRGHRTWWRHGTLKLSMTFNSPHTVQGIKNVTFHLSTNSKNNSVLFCFMAISLWTLWTFKIFTQQEFYDLYIGLETFYSKINITFC